MVNKKEESEIRKGKNIRFTIDEVKEINDARKILGLDFSNFVRLAAKEKIIKTKKLK